MHGKGLFTLKGSRAFEECVREIHCTILSEVNLPRISQPVFKLDCLIWILALQLQWWVSLIVSLYYCLLDNCFLLVLFTTIMMFPPHPHIVYKCIFFNHTLDQKDLGKPGHFLLVSCLETRVLSPKRTYKWFLWKQEDICIWESWFCLPPPSPFEE